MSVATLFPTSFAPLAKARTKRAARPSASIESNAIMMPREGWAETATGCAGISCSCYSYEALTVCGPFSARSAQVDRSVPDRLPSSRRGSPACQHLRAEGERRQGIPVVRSILPLSRTLGCFPWGLFSDQNRSLAPHQRSWDMGRTSSILGNASPASLVSRD